VRIFGAGAPKTRLSASIPRPLEGAAGFPLQSFAPHRLIADLNLLTVAKNMLSALKLIKEDKNDI
jgi:hypothetical protein